MRTRGPRSTEDRCGLQNEGEGEAGRVVPGNEEHEDEGVDGSDRGEEDLRVAEERQVWTRAGIRRGGRRGRP